MYRAIVFDFFDVIHSDPFKAWLTKYDIQDKQSYYKSVLAVDKGEITLDEFFQVLSQLSGNTIKAIEKEFQKRHILDEGLVPLIEHLRQSYKIALLSNAGSEEIRPLIKEHEYDKLFHEIAISSETGFIKPTQEAFNHVLSKLAVKPEETIFVDDNQRNVDAANKFGITGLLFIDLPSLKAGLQTLGVKV